MAKSLSQTIREAPPHAHVRVKSAELTETIVVEKPLTLLADAPGRSVLQPIAGAACIRILSDAHIFGFVLRPGDAPATKAIEVVGGRSVIENCLFEGVNTGIEISGRDASCTVRACRFERCGVGINVFEGASAVLTDCTIDRAGGFGLIANSHSSIRANDCVFSAATMCSVIIYNSSVGRFEGCEWVGSPSNPNSAGRMFNAQLHVMDSGMVELSECRIISGCAAGFQVGKDARARLTNCLVEANDWAGIQVSERGRAELYDCSVLNNGGAGVAVADGAFVSGLRIRSTGNKAAGLAAIAGGFDFKESQLQGNLVGTVLSRQGSGRFERSDLSRNAKGPALYDPDSVLECLDCVLET